VEILLEHAHGVVQRIARHIDDFCLREDRLDQADIDEACRVYVDFFGATFGRQGISRAGGKYTFQSMLYSQIQGL
jgi:hypothetical protein